MDNVQKITNNYLLIRGFTASIKDILTDKKIDNEIATNINKTIQEVNYMVSIENMLDKKRYELLNSEIITKLDSLVSNCSEKIRNYFNKDKINNIRNMVLSGAKVLHKYYSNFGYSRSAKTW